LRLVVEDERMVLVPETGLPFTSLRGLMRNEWKQHDVNGLIEQTKRSLFKVQDGIG